MNRYEIWEVSWGNNECIPLGLFEIWVLNLSLKEETMKNIYNQNEAGVAHYIIVFYTQELGTCFDDSGILV